MSTLDSFRIFQSQNCIQYWEFLKIQNFIKKMDKMKILTTTTDDGTQNPATCVTHMEQCTDIPPMLGLFQSLMTPSMDTCGRTDSGPSRPRWTMVFPPPEDPGLRRGGEAGLLVDGGLGGATHQHDPARLLMFITSIAVSYCYSIYDKYIVHVCVSSSPHPQCIVVPRPVTNLVTDLHNAESLKSQCLSTVCQKLIVLSVK